MDHGNHRYSAAKAQQREREAKEHEREVRIILDDIKQLLTKPGTTLEDVKRAVGVSEGLGIGDKVEAVLINGKGA